MRIVAGSRGGRRLKPPQDRAIRPTPDRVREALFAILADRIPGARFLDLFAGTGANGLEALSRGARSAHFVEQAQKAQEIIRENIRKLEFESLSHLTGGTLPSVLSSFTAQELRFEIIFADPPYESALLHKLLSNPHLPNLLAPGGVLIVEVGRRGEVSAPLWRLDSTRDYGDTRLFFLSTPCHRPENS